MAKKQTSRPSYMTQRVIKEHDLPVVAVNADAELPDDVVLYPGLTKKPANRTHKGNPRYRDFREFLKMFFNALGYVTSETNLDVANYLQGGLWDKTKDGRLVRSPFDDSDYQFPSEVRYKVVMSWRGMSKTLITSAFAAWLLYWNPQFKVLIVSSGTDHAKRIMEFLRIVVQTLPELKPLMPTPGQLNSVSRGMNVSAAEAAVQPSILALGVDGQTRGKRADFILVDDIETDKNTATEKLRSALVKKIEEFWNQLLPGGTIVFLGTPARSSSIYTEELTAPEGNFRCDMRIFPVRIPTQEQIAFYGHRLGCYVKDLIEQGVPEWTAYDPRFTEQVLTDEKRIPKSSFMLEYMLDTSQTDSNIYPLRLSDLMVAKIDIEAADEWYEWDETNRDGMLPMLGFKRDFWVNARTSQSAKTVPFTKRLMAIDPSGRGKDKTAYVILYLSRGKVFLVKAGSLSGGYTTQTFELLALMARDYRVNHIIVEPNFGDGMWKDHFAPTLMRIHPCTLEDSEWSTTRKEERIIQSLELAANRHKIVVDKAVIIEDSQRDLLHQLFYQYTRIVKKKEALAHDDLVDALAIGVAFFSSQNAFWGEDKQIADEKTAYDELEDLLMKRGVFFGEGGQKLNFNSILSQPKTYNFTKYVRRDSNG